MAITLPVYLDYNATTPVDPRVLEVMIPLFTRDFGNAASRMHRYGWKAEAIVKDARETIAASFGAKPEEIVFTSGATESDNLAVLGVARKERHRGNHIVTSTIEHKAVLDAAVQLQSEGFEVTFLSPDSWGVTSAEAVERALTDQTTLVSIMAANNEIGTINPIRDIGAVCRARGVLFHTDAVQAFGKIPLNADDWNVDLLSITAHKLYGPKGVGALFVRSRNPRVQLEPLFHGGGHERGLRSGTLNVPGIAGFAAAVRIAMATLPEESARITGLRDAFQREILAGLDGIHINGHPAARLPGTLNLSFDGVDGESLLMDLRDLAVSSGAACTSASLDPSHVLSGIGLSPEAAHSSIRFSLGRFTTSGETTFAARRVISTVRNLRESDPRHAGKRKAD